MKLHLGCGNKIYPDWVNIDKYDVHATVRMDIVDLPPYNPNSVDEIYTSHTVEHLSPDRFKKGLRRWYQILKPRGILVIRCPNAEFQLRRYVEASTEELFKNASEYVINIIGHQKSGLRNQNLLTRELLIKYVEDAGFDIDSCNLVSNRCDTLVKVLKDGGRDRGTTYEGVNKRDLWCKAYKSGGKNDTVI